MKHLVLTIVALVALLTLLVVGASFLLKSSVEDMTREAIMSVADPGEAALEDVTFSPLSREILITGWRARHSTPEGPVAARALRVHGYVTVRGILACLPVVGNLLNDADTEVPVLDRLKANDVGWSDADRGVSAEFLELGVLRLRYGLLQQYSTGLRPPFATIVDGVRIDRLEIRKGSLQVWDGASTLSMNFAHLLARDIHGTSARRVEIEDLAMSQNGQGQGRTTCKTATLEDIVVSTSLLSELLALGSQPPSPSGRSYLIEALANNGPLVGRTTLREVASTDSALPFTIANWEILWKDDLNLSIESHIRGMAIPARNFENAFGLSLSGMNSVLADADLSSTGIKENRQKGVLRLKGLADFSYELLLLPNEYALRDLSMTLQDYGLTARIARTISPDAPAAAMLLKALAGHLCQADRGEQAAQCQKLGQFVDAPGTLKLASPKGRKISFFELLGVSGRFGSLFEVSVTPGARTLDEQYRELFPKAG